MAPHSLDMEPSPTPPLGASHTLPVNGHSTWNSSASHTTAPVATAEEVFSEKGFNIDKLRRPALPPGASSEYQKKKKFPRISRPVELLKRDYDVVVIGSGYGGSVAASRMARGRKSVCLLELGRERWRTSYRIS